MSGTTKRKAQESAGNVIPLGIPDRELIISWFVKGYMAGHAAHTRWANKKVEAYRFAQGKPPLGPTSEIDFSVLVTRWAKDGPEAGSVTHVLEAGAALANAIHVGMGPMIRGTFMEADFRNALKLRDGESVNFRRNGRSEEPKHG